MGKEIIMGDFINLIQEIFMLKKDNSVKVGLTQFKRDVYKPAPKQASIRNKDVKLSDLMRRAG